MQSEQAADNVVLRLPRDFVGQVLDGLDVLIEQWDYTAEYLEHGMVRDDVLIRECSDAAEASAIAEYYRRIREAIREQYARGTASPGDVG
jgi:hypothetical protein